MKLSVENLEFSYGSAKVLNGISFEIDAPGLTCIIGPNGVGKSTLVKCIDGICMPTAGTVSLNGRNIADIPRKNLAKIMAFVPVVSGDMFSMTVFDTVMMGRRPHQKLGNTTAIDREITRRTLNMMGIRDLSMRESDELSAGQHQRMVISRGLAQTPRFLLLDEPTANLDARHQIQVAMRLRDLATRNEMSIIMISHDLNIASRFADKVIMMASPGIIYAIGSPEEVITESAIEDIYGVGCEIVNVKGRPHVILLDPI